MGERGGSDRWVRGEVVRRGERGGVTRTVSNYPGGLHNVHILERLMGGCSHSNLTRIFQS